MKFFGTLLMLPLALMLLFPKTSNTLFDDATPEGSALSIWVCDGEDSVEYGLYNDELETEIIKKLKNTEATAVEYSTESIEFPTYCLILGTQDGTSLQMCWSNGLLFTHNGTVYEFDFDFAGLLEDYEFKQYEPYEELRMLGGVEWYLVKDENGWNADLMKKSPELTIPDGISFDVSFDGERFDLTFRNDGAEAWRFGKRYSLQVRLGDAWYEVPLLPGKTRTTEQLALILAPGQTIEQSYSTELYGELPTGRYRLFAYGLTYEFEVN